MEDCHSLRGKAKDGFRKLDHCSIYLLIAGTYTPFALVTLRRAWGWSLFGSVARGGGSTLYLFMIYFPSKGSHR